MGKRVLSPEEKVRTEKAIVHLTLTYGYPPTLRELGAHLDLNFASVHHRLSILRDEGRIDWEPSKSRTVRLAHLI